MIKEKSYRSFFFCFFCFVLFLFVCLFVFFVRWVIKLPQFIFLSWRQIRKSLALQYWEGGWLKKKATGHFFCFFCFVLFLFVCLFVFFVRWVIKLPQFIFFSWRQIRKSLALQYWEGGWLKKKATGHFFCFFCFVLFLFVCLFVFFVRWVIKLPQFIFFSWRQIRKSLALQYWEGGWLKKKATGHVFVFFFVLFLFVCVFVFFVRWVIKLPQFIFDGVINPCPRLEGHLRIIWRCIVMACVKCALFIALLLLFFSMVNNPFFFFSSSSSRCCCCYAAVMQLLCCCYAAVMQLLCCCYAAVMQLLCCCYAAVMQLLCRWNSCWESRLWLHESQGTQEQKMEKWNGLKWPHRRNKMGGWPLNADPVVWRATLGRWHAKLGRIVSFFFFFFLIEWMTKIFGRVHGAIDLWCGSILG